MLSRLSRKNHDETSAENADSVEVRDKNLAASPSLQDKLINGVIEQFVSSSSPDIPFVDVGKPPRGGPLKNGLSTPLMADNFRRFNARIGVVFHFRRQIERLLEWRTTSHTFSFLATFSLVCLHSNLLVVLAPAVLLLFVVVPGFLARHLPPPETSTSSTTAYYSYEGPALAPAHTVKPAPETSRDFFDNMADLQKSMGDFSNAYDAIVAALVPTVNFSNERFSSLIFLVVTVAAMCLLMAAHMVPWYLVVLVSVNSTFLSHNPNVRWHLSQILSYKWDQDRKGDSEEGEEGGKSSTSLLLSLYDFFSAATAISLTAQPEAREVEVFELQHKVSSPYSPQPTWEAFVFIPTPYDRLSPQRIAGGRPRGCRFFEDVGPPPGWVWKTPKWELDLEAREWVFERMVVGVGVEDGKEQQEYGEMGGWVWDLPSDNEDSDEFGDDDEVTGEEKRGEQGNEGDHAPPSYAPDDCVSKTKVKEIRAKQKHTVNQSKKKTRDRLQKEDVVELVCWGLAGLAMGEWRRRRWLRVVRRISADEQE
ncbi:hypothetical protein KEM55_006672 [Ascosphaera atra]|nr:hypothetical protein KEM55_006672 [Ascosphaera atra]